MANNSVTKKVILDIITKLRGDETKQINAVKQLKGQFGSLTTFIRAAKVEYGGLDKAILKLDRVNKRGRISKEEKNNAIASAEKLKLDYALATVRIKNQELRVARKIRASQERKQNLLRKQREEEKAILIEKRKQREEDIKAARLRGARLGYNLSLMFASMNVAHKIGDTLKDWFTSYDRIIQGQNKYTNGVNKLSASLAFMKFSFIDAFANTKFAQDLMKTFAKLSEYVANIVSAHPKIAIGVVVGGGIVSKVASLAAWVAQFALLKDAINTLKAAKSVSTTIDVTSTLSDKAKHIFDVAKNGLPIVAKIGVTVAAAAITAEIMGKLSKPLQTVGAWIGSKLEKMLGVEFSRRIVYNIGSALYAATGKLGKFGDWILSKFGTDRKQLKENLDNLKQQIDLDKLKKVEISTENINNAHMKFDTITKESTASKFWDTILSKMDTAIDKYERLQQLHNTLFPSLPPESQYSHDTSNYSPLRG